MTTCKQQFRLSITGTGCPATNSGGKIASCQSDDAIECCDEAVLGTRSKRQNVRQQLHDYILLKLGAPVIDLELDEQQIDLAISEALDVWEDYAPREFYQYYTFPTSPGKSVYTMPPEVGHIREVSYREMPNFGFQSADLGGQIPLEYFAGGVINSGSSFLDQNAPIYGQMGVWTLYKQHLQMFNRLSSSLGGWEWVGGRNNIKLYPIPCKPQQVIVHYLQKCKDWECNYQSIREGALASAMMMVGEIRSKYQNIPGPSGGTVLNGADILQRGRDMWDKFEERLLYRYGDLLPITTG